MNRLKTIALATTLAIASSASVMAQTANQVRPAQPMPKEKCLKSLTGGCTNPTVVEAARLRAIIIPAVTVSYFGTPAGTVGGDYIPFERFFQDNPTVFGLPTNFLFAPGCCIRRSK